MSEMMMAPIDFRWIVQRAAERVEDISRVKIAAEAIDILVARAKQHEDDVRRAMAAENLDERDLIEAAVEQLQEAVRALPPRGEFGGPTYGLAAPQTVGPREVALGMRRRCWFVPWC